MASATLNAVYSDKYFLPKDLRRAVQTFLLLLACSLGLLIDIRWHVASWFSSLSVFKRHKIYI